MLYLCVLSSKIRIPDRKEEKPPLGRVRTSHWGDDYVSHLDLVVRDGEVTSKTAVWDGV